MLLNVYALLFWLALLGLALWYGAELMEWILEKRKKKGEKVIDSRPTQKSQNCSNACESGDERSKAFEEQLDTMEGLLRFAVTLLVIIGGAFFNWLRGG